MLCAFILCATSVRAETEPFTGAPQLFGHKEVVHRGTAAFTKWVASNQSQARAAQTEQTREWKSFLATLRGQGRREQIEAVNHYMNKIAYIADKQNYGVDDYWATIEEFMTRGGDCEDYALAKYRSLMQLGFSANELRLVILYDQDKRINHAVLAVMLDGKWKILDNQVQNVRDDDEISNYKPIYAISQNSWWRFI